MMDFPIFQVGPGQCLKKKGVDPRPFSAHLTFLGDGLVGEMAWMLFDPPKWVLVEDGCSKDQDRPVKWVASRKTNECPLKKRDYFSREYIFQPLIFRGHVNFQGCSIFPTIFREKKQKRSVCFRTTSDISLKGKLTTSRTPLHQPLWH